MGCMYRSELMSLCNIYLQPEVAFGVISELGEMSCVQLLDMHPDTTLFHSNYIQEICRCSELERKLRYMENQMIIHKIPIYDMSDEPKAVPIHEMVQFEALIEKWRFDIKEITNNEKELLENYLKLSELSYVLQCIGPILGKAELTRESQMKAKARTAAAGDIPGAETGRLIVVTGVVRRNVAFTFEIMLWRMSRGMIFYRQAKEDRILTDPATHNEIRKVAFLIICQGDELGVRVEKVCTGFKVNTYMCPSTYVERMRVYNNLTERIYDLEQVLNKTRYLRCKALRTVSKQYQKWMTRVKKSKAVYHQMNMFDLDITKKVLIGQAWIPDSDLERVHKTFAKCCHAFQTNVESFINKIGHDMVPPTYHRVNKFTRGFQNLINAYGDSTYRELNPGLYTVITFPFLFGIMFGDVGHGFLMFFFALWMWINEAKFLKKKSDNEIWNIIFGGRYIILLMGAFSIFTGFCYNDCFGKPFTFGRSYFKNQKSVEEISREEFIDIDPSISWGDVYLFGIDPMWSFSKNRIMVENSIKMKLSIIIGIIHMIFGVCLSVLNYRYFKRTYSILLQFIPEIVFLTFLFFWLVILIYYKWFTYSARSPDPEYGSSCAPQILILFIDMTLMSNSMPPHETCARAYMFDGQRMIQTMLLIIALCMVPILLFGSPLYKKKFNEINKKAAEQRLLDFKNENHDTDEDNVAYQQKTKELQAEIEKYSIPFSEIMINQAVHTIEYVLSTISHTASYLRLWALSLAHAQLSDMLFEMVLSRLALKDHSMIGSIKIYVIFAVWAVFSICILVVMEGLSAFLHTLRLHWVEFMSKFYSGGGHIFQPFSFVKVLESEGDKSEAGCKKMMLKVEKIETSEKV